MKRCRVAMRDREHPQRHHAGKLNGVMPATTPSGCRSGPGVDAGRPCLGEFALQQMRDAAGELHHLEPALDLAFGVVTAPCRVRR